ncbi:MFS transporter [Arthrobacter sp. ISL-28]|nr:MFS transporter [Arthrobacter sp. ISL-28]
MISGAFLVTAVFALSNSPTPLYVRWQAQLGFSAGTLTLIFAAYIAGLLLTLLIAGQLADRLGRKPVLIPGLVLAIVACLLFAIADSVLLLGLARFLTGIAVGVIVSAGMAAVVDLGGPARKRQASLAASVAMVLGAGLGPLLAGTFAQISPDPVLPLFTTELIILASALVVAGTLPLKGHRERAALEDATKGVWRLPQVPHQYQMHLLYGMVMFAPGITATSFVLSLGPSLLAKLLNVSSPLIAGSMACIMFLTATGVQLAVSRLCVRTIFLLGSTATIAAMITLVIAVNASQAAFLVISAALAGAGQGLGQLGGLTLIGTQVPGTYRAEANSILNIGGYISAGLIPVATGFLIDGAGLGTGATAFATILTAASIAALAFVHRRLQRT